MECLTLIRIARASGCTVEEAGGKLVVVGARTHESVARELLSRKAEVVEALRTEGQLPDRPEDREGFLVEVIRRNGQPLWNQRQIDAADRAVLALRAAPRPDGPSKAPESTQEPPVTPGGIQPDPDLCRVPDGWTPASWKRRLLYLSGACRGTNPERADSLAASAAVVAPDVFRRSPDFSAAGPASMP